VFSLIAEEFAPATVAIAFSARRRGRKPSGRVDGAVTEWFEF
jgi:hypothetical protein